MRRQKKKAKDIEIADLSCGVTPELPGPLCYHDSLEGEKARNVTPKRYKSPSIAVESDSDRPLADRLVARKLFSASKSTTGALPSVPSNGETLKSSHPHTPPPFSPLEPVEDECDLEIVSDINEARRIATLSPRKPGTAAAAQTVALSSSVLSSIEDNRLDIDQLIEAGRIAAFSHNKSGTDAAALVVAPSSTILHCIEDSQLDDINPEEGRSYVKEGSFEYRQSLRKERRSQTPEYAVGHPHPFSTEHHSESQQASSTPFQQEHGWIDLGAVLSVSVQRATYGYQSSSSPSTSTAAKEQSANDKQTPPMMGWVSEPDHRVREFTPINVYQEGCETEEEDDEMSDAEESY